MADLDLEPIKAMLACLTPYDEQYRLGAIYCAAPTTIAALVAEVERLRALMPREHDAGQPRRFCWLPDHDGPGYNVRGGGTKFESCLLDAGHEGACMGQTRFREAARCVSE